jgi:hypothetical protein
MLFSKIIAAAAFVVTVTAFPLLGNGKQVSGVSAEQAVLAVAQKLQTTIAPAVADASESFLCLCTCICDFPTNITFLV